MKYYLLRRKFLGKLSTTKIAEFSKTGISAVRNDAIPEEEADIVFRWGCTSTVKAKKVLNHAEGIHLVSDKAGFRLALQEQQPWWPTWQKIEDVQFPAVVRPYTHSQGRNLYVVNSKAEMVHAASECGPGWYAARLIPKVAEYRVFVVSGRAVCVAAKTPMDNVAWNVAQGGHFSNVRWNDWPLKAVKRSIKAMLLTGLDYGGVDIMVDAEGETYILEINSAPSLTSSYRQQCFAKAFDYIVENGNEIIPLQTAPGGYKKFIHPAVAEDVSG